MKKVLITIMTVVLVGTMTLGAYAGNGRGNGAGPGDGSGPGTCDGTYCDGTCDGTQPRDGSGSQHGRR